MKLLLKHCCVHPASLLSVHKMHRDLRSQGVAVSKNTLYEYLGHLQDAYVLFLVPKHSSSLREQEQNPRKIHLIDVGLNRAFSVYPDRDVGHKLENVVFLHERRKTKAIFYYANAHEVDLYCPGPDGARFVNVAWSLSDLSSHQRELAAMEFGAARYPEAEGVLVAHEIGNAPSQADEIEAVPAWRYLAQI
jgi:predicted AAA+ superfamily ATPase